MQRILAGLLVALSSQCALATAAPAPRPWTLLVYGAADNNADGPILGFLDSVRKAIDDDPGLDVLLFIDRHELYSDDATLLGEDFTGARLFRLKRDSAERLSGGTQFPEITLERDAELDSADARTLARFIEWGKATSPAERYGVMIYSHANGETMCPDEHSERDMPIAAITHAASEAESVDFLALELCNMAGIEIAYQWRPVPGRFGAKILLAIPNAGPPLDWDRAFRRIRTPGHATEAEGTALDPAAMTAEDFGRLVVEEGERGRRALAANGGGRASHEAAACIDLAATANVKRAVDALAVALSAADAKATVLAARGMAESDCAINYADGGPFVDLYDLCRRLGARDDVDQPTREALEQVEATVDRCVLASFGMDGYRSFVPGKSGVFITLPSAGPGRWRSFTWYSPLAGDTLQTYGRWDFLADGAAPGNGVVENWFELLDDWFDESVIDGGANRYEI